MCYVEYDDVNLNSRMWYIHPYIFCRRLRFSDPIEKKPAVRIFVIKINHTFWHKHINLKNTLTKIIIFFGIARHKTGTAFEPGSLWDQWTNIIYINLYDPLKKITIIRVVLNSPEAKNHLNKENYHADMDLRRTPFVEIRLIVSAFLGMLYQSSK